MKSLCIAVLTTVVSYAAGAATISGRVSDILDDNGISGVSVKVYDLQKELVETKPFRKTKTVRDGTYELLDLPLGKYELRYVKQRYQTRPTRVEVQIIDSQLVTTDVELLKEGGTRDYYAKMRVKLENARENAPELSKLTREFRRLSIAVNPKDYEIIEEEVHKKPLEQKPPERPKPKRLQDQY